MRFFVTGVTGFIGERLVEFLTGRGDVVHALSRTGCGGNSTCGNRLVFRGDVLDQTSIERAMSGCDCVFHLAGYAKNWARNPDVFFNVNGQGTQNVLQAALTLGIRKVVYTSSAMTIGPSDGSPLDEASVRATPMLTHYESSKAETEKIVMRFVEQGLDAVVVNPTRVFGPGRLTEGNSLTRMIKLYLEGKWRLIPGDGEALGNYAFVEDVVLGHVLALEKGRTGERYILGGENASYNSLFKLVAELSLHHHRLFHVPERMAIAASRAEEWRAWTFHGYPSITPGWSRTFMLDSAYSCRKAERELGYRITPLSVALRRTVDWLRNSCQLD